ncbi:MAG: YhgE/Pip domain-containing protein [Lachnospiraceae bacterium]|nr:YhgE/Pip domain-containing protein [Lachnospiraceae bacterium]
MMNVFKIFRDDVRRLLKNPIALIVIIGVAVLPSLYAWFNIIANWDPYGSTGNIAIAVVNSDKGATLEGISLNLGDQVENSLRTNDKMGWTFVDEDEAVEGTKSGKYYAAIVMPETFSEDTISILSGEPVKPVIQYYTNGKKNAIAQKITNAGVSTVQESVNQTFIATLTEQLENIILAGGSSLEEKNVTGKIVENLEEVSGGLTKTSEALNAFHATVQAFETMNDTVQTSVLNLTAQLDTAINDLNTVKGKVESIKENTGMYTSMQVDVSGIDSLIQQLQNVADSMEEIDSDLPLENSGLIQEQKQQISEIRVELQTNIDDMKNEMQNIIRLSTSTMAADMEGNIDVLIQSLEAVKADIAMAGSIFEQLGTALEKTDVAFQNTITLIDESQAEINENIDKISTLSNGEAIQQLMGMISDHSEYISSFMSAPVELETKDVYPVENYGSAMTPFYSILAIWVGAIILVAIIKTNVKNKSAYNHFKPYQEYLGRYLFFLIMALLQSLTICLGDIFFLKIQCEHPVAFVFTGLICSFVFSLIIFTITISFGDIGKAICVILLVIQLGGGGGTFPIEVTPKFFQILYPLLPFTHGINAMRECVAGMYGMDYVMDICYLLVYVPFMLVLGLLLRNPLIRANEFFERKLKDTEIM